MSVPAPLLAHYASGSSTLAWAIRLERSDGEVYGWTSADRDATIDAQLYAAAPGLDVSSFATSAGFGVDNAEITILPDDEIITRVDIIAGRWDNAAWTLLRYNWADVSDGVEVRATGHLGELQPKSGAYVAELRGLQQFLQQPVGSPSTKTCRYRLGSTAMPAGLCMVDLGPFTETGTVTSVASKQVFTDTSRTEADDYFGEGVLTWTGGLNTGLSQKVRTYAADVFTLSLPMIFPIEVGDTYSVHAGCRKRLDEDCVAKFANGLNFGGEPHRPTVDELTSTPEVNV
jgi:uncharacterized phage protein (TIGR02218 family)